MRIHEYHVSMVRCRDGSYYTGITNDVERRVRQHNEGINPACFTFKRRPVELVYSCFFENVHEAISWEKALKKWSRVKKEALIRGDEDALHLLASCQNASHSLNLTIDRTGVYIRNRVMVRLRSP